MEIYSSFTEAWHSELQKTMFDGDVVAPRGMKTKERQWVQFGVDDPLTFPVTTDGRDFVHVIGLLEGLQLVGQFSLPEQFTQRVNNFNNFTDGGVFHGSYGARSHARLIDLAHTLEMDTATRQAVLTIYDSKSDLGATKRDIPCTLNFQFLWDHSELGMRVNMRSNDLWLGTPYDFTQFAMLQASLAQAMGDDITPGLYVHTVGSLHLYERDEPAAMQVGEHGEPGAFEFPLWSPEVTGDMAAISRRARDLSFGYIEPETWFEEWALGLI